MESSLSASSPLFRPSRPGDDWWSPPCLPALHSSDPPDQEMVGGVLPVCQPSTLQTVQTRRWLEESSLPASSPLFRPSRPGDDWWSPSCLPALNSSDPPDQEMIGGVLPACQLSTLQTLQSRRWLVESSLPASSPLFRPSRPGDDWWSPSCLPALHSADPPDQEMIGGVLPACQLSTLQTL